MFVVQQFILWVCRHGSLHQAGQDLGVASRCGVVQRCTTLGVPTQRRSFVLQQGRHTIVVTQQRLRGQKSGIKCFSRLESQVIFHHSNPGLFSRRTAALGRRSYSKKVGFFFFRCSTAVIFKDVFRDYANRRKGAGSCGRLPTQQDAATIRLGFKSV